MAIVKSSNTIKVVRIGTSPKVIITEFDRDVNFVRFIKRNKVARNILKPKIISHKAGNALDTSRFRYNQSPTETPDGVIVVFTLPNSDVFVSGLLEVFINGNQKIKGVEWEETGTTQITLLGDMASTPPTADEVIKFNYITV